MLFKLDIKGPFSNISSTFFFFFDLPLKLRVVYLRNKQKNSVTNMEFYKHVQYIFFYSLLFRDASTSLVISRLGSLGVYQNAVYFYCCAVNVSFVTFTGFNLWCMNLMNNGQMDRGNENPTQHLPWWLRKTMKKPQSGWSAPGFEPGTSRMLHIFVSMLAF